ncbi:MAG: hypothetical protein KDK41_03810 [Leptospiraceae bacterium]|nr:hypothetical protein [Leptospiraceae bacterium]
MLTKQKWPGQIGAALFLSVTLLFAGESVNFKTTVAEAFTQYEFLFSDANEEIARGSWEDMHSYLPDLGVRSKYFILRKYFSISLLEKMFSMPVFVSGPHKNGNLDYNSQNNFGYYNPKFVRAFHKEFMEVIRHSKFKTAAREIYTAHLQNLARQTYLAYHFVLAHPERKIMVETYKNYMENADSCETFQCQPWNYLGGNMAPLSYEPKEVAHFNYYEGHTMGGFWVRRMIDGTADEFYSLLREVMKELDSDF